jgi:proto-oncogene tyrosine-protein kinase Ret
MIKVSEIGNNHVVQLLGCIVAKTPMAMIMEFCPFGDLHSNLVQWRKEIGAYVKPNFKTDPDSISLVSDMDCQYAQEELKEGDLFSFAHQIAIGMRYLASMNVIHRDLACRNVLVGENKILKISDFGLSKEIDGIYASTSNTKLPLRWMSPEAIRQRLFSEKSDVWSYGVCLWEICTLGKIPYEDKTNAEVATAVAESLLLDKPYKCHDEIYKMMLDCWKMDASDRPTFKDIEKHFEQLIMNECSDLYIAIHNILEVPDKTNSHVDPVCQTEGKEPGKFPEQGVH